MERSRTRNSMHVSVGVKAGPERKNNKLVRKKGQHACHPYVQETGFLQNKKYSVSSFAEEMTLDISIFIQKANSTIVTYNLLLER